MCSSPTLVSSTTRERRTLVASCLPPSPASTTATSTPASAKAASAAAVSDSNWVAPISSAAARTRPSAVSMSTSCPSTLIRSAKEWMCGEIVAPVERPSASSSCSIVRVAVDLPFVPTTWMAGNASCGSPSAPSNARMRSRPKPSTGHGLSPATHATALTGGQPVPPSASSSRR